MSDLKSESRDGDGLDPSLRAAFTCRVESVVDALPQLRGRARRARLIDPDDEAAVLIDPRSREVLDAGHYRVDGEIARGGVGVVLKGHDVDLGREVAVKVLREEHLDNPDLIARFVEEAQIGGQLQHPGIVPVYELGLRADRRPFFTMKLVKGRTLAALLSERKDADHDRRRYLAIFEAVCQTIAYAHSRGVVHRDLKPSNVMVGAFGEVQVVDWGLAKVLARGGVADERRSKSDAGVIETVRSGPTASGSLVGSVMGTPAYMPPEQARGEIERVDERSDVFSLGAILCEMLTGAPPYTAEGAALLQQAINAELDDARSRLDACSADAELTKIAKSCLRSEPRTRPRNADLIAKRISDHFASAGARTRAAQLEAAEASARAQAERKARKLTLSLAGALLIAITLGGGGLWWVERGRIERRVSTDRAVESALAELAVFKVRGALVESLAAAQRAVELAKTGEASPDLVDRAAQARSDMDRIERDVRMSRRLEEIRTKDAVRSDWPGADGAYSAAFRDFGIDVEILSVADAAARIRETTIPHELAVSLDWWCIKKRVLNSGQVERDKLRAIIVSVVGGTGSWPAAAPRRELAEHAAAVNVDAEHPDSIDLLAATLAANGDSDGARALYVRAVRSHPGSFCLNLGAATWSSTCRPIRLVDARAYAQAAVAVRPESGEAWNLLGVILRNLTDLESAEVALRTATEIDPGEPMYRSNLGDALAQLDRFDEALVEHQRAVGLSSTPEDEASARSYLGHILLVTGDDAAAEDELLRSIELDHGCEEAWFHLGSLLGSRGEFEPAMEALHEAIHLAPNTPKAHYLLARCLDAVGETGEALKAIAREKALAPTQEVDAFEYHLLAVQRLKDVLPALIRGESLEIPAPDKMAFAAEVAKAGRAALALRLAKEALAAEPSLAHDLAAGHLYDAARYAACVGSGSGIDLEDVDGEVRSRALTQSLTWLKQVLAALEHGLASSRVDRSVVCRHLQWWLSDDDLASVRDPEHLEALPEIERRAAEALWSRVRDLLDELR